MTADGGRPPRRGGPRPARPRPATPAAVAAAEELVRVLMDFYGAGAGPDRRPAVGGRRRRTRPAARRRGAGRTAGAARTAPGGHRGPDRPRPAGHRSRHRAGRGLRRSRPASCALRAARGATAAGARAPPRRPGSGSRRRCRASPPRSPGWWSRRRTPRRASRCCSRSAPGRRGRREHPGRGGAGLRRFLAPAPPRPERCELCGEAVPEEPPAPGGHRRGARWRAPAPAARCCSTARRRRAAAGSAASRTATWSTAGRVSTRRPGRALSIPVGMAFFFHNSALDRLVALYPSPAGATESELDPAELAGGLRRHPRWPRCCEPDVEALLVRARPARNDACFLVPDRRLLRTGGPDAAALAGLRRRTEARDALAEFFAGWIAGHRGAPRGGDRVTRARLQLRPEVRTDPYAAGPTLVFRLRITGVRGRAGARPRAALPAADRARAGAATAPRRARGSTTCSASGPAGAPPCSRCSSPRCRWWCPASPGRPRWICRCRARYDMDIAATRYFRRSTDGEVPLLLLFSGTAFSGPGGFQVSPVPWDKEASCRMPVRGVAGDDRGALPRLRLDPAAARRAWTTCSPTARRAHCRRGRRPYGRCSTPRRSRAAPPVAHAVTGTGAVLVTAPTASARLSEPAVRRRAPGRRRRAVRGLRPLPLPGVGREEPAALAVRRAGAARLGHRQRRALLPAHRVPDGAARRRARSRSSCASCTHSAGPSSGLAARRRLRDGRPVWSCADRVLVPWDEGVEERVQLEVGVEATAGGRRRSCRSPARRASDTELAARRGRTPGGAAGADRGERVDGVLRLTAAELPGPYRVLRLTAVVENTSAGHRSRTADREAALPRSLLSAHLVLGLAPGRLPVDDRPAASGREAAVAACRNEHTWPVLAGADGARGRGAVLADHPGGPSGHRPGESRARCTTPPRSTRSSRCAPPPSPTRRSARRAAPTTGRRP